MNAETIEKCGIKAARIKFENEEEVFFVNTTPHNITFKDPLSGDEFEVPCSGVVVNAKPSEVGAESPFSSIGFVKTKFTASPEEAEKVEKIKRVFGSGVLIIGSIIAAQAFPGSVVAMTPHPEYIRVPPAEKRMNPRKFTVF